MICDMDDLCRRLEILRRIHYRIVTTNGCFDVLHIGHTRYLETARRLGDILVVLVNSDASVRRLKGKDRPLVPEAERAEVLDALRVVDYVTVFDELCPCAALREIRPDVHVKGGDYVVDDLPEASLIKSLGGQMVVVEHVEGKSTTALIASIRQVQDHG